MFQKRFWKNFDLILLVVTLLLTSVGILVLYSIRFHATDVGSSVDVRNQIIFTLGGLIGLFVAARIDYRTWAKFTAPLYGLMLMLLIIVMLAGKSALGATRWINLGFFQFQPSELAKLVLIIVLARFFADHYEQMDQPRYMIASVLYLILPLGLVLGQPDLGTAMVLGVVWLAMILMTKIPKYYFLIAAALAVVMFPIGYRFLGAYQKARLAVFLHPAADPQGRGFNVLQSTIAVGSGQIFGRGLAAGSQSQLNFLPSQHTDFIFAVLAEKLGLIGGILLLFLFGLMLSRGLLIAYRAQDRFGMFLAIGLVSMFFFHVFINVGMNMGIMPVTGIPLPFISYGGTSLIIGLIGVGLLESINVRRKKLEFGN
ncbi:MAG: rod shape-determining protein RodA [Candidatus Saccharimonadia bacterium]